MAGGGTVHGTARVLASIKPVVSIIIGLGHRERDGVPVRGRLEEGKDGRVISR